MSDFLPKTAAAQPVTADPTKHVHFAQGMVLGVDDFNQEFAYLAGRDQLLTRTLLGYGTACGLQLRSEAADGQQQIMVGPGIAVSPRGQFISVPVAQCASLNDWLTAHIDEVRDQRGSPPDAQIDLHVLLCYRECLTDQVPIPGEPCRDESEAMAASRVTDDFKLELRFTPPEQREEQALRDFVAWFNQIEIAAPLDVLSSPPGSAKFADETQLVQAIRDAALMIDSPPSSPPDFMFGSPPATLRIRAEDACDLLRVALRIWTTELRPRWLGKNQTCAGAPPDEGCVLLGTLHVPVDADGLLNGIADIDETQRPYLLHLRLLQEWLLCGRHEALPSDQVTAATEFGLGSDAGMSERYSRADHTHGTPAVGGDVAGTAGDLLVTGLRHVDVIYDESGPQAAQVLTAAQGEDGIFWRPADLPQLQGDATGAINMNTVERLRGIPIVYDEDGPNPSQVLTFVQGEDGNGTWQPADLPQGPATSLDGDVTGPANGNTITRLQKQPVEAFEPQFGQVLTFVGQGENEGGVWRPMDLQSEPGRGPFVTHPPEAGPYSIVAAGVVRGERDRRRTVYNGLAARVEDVGRIKVTFNGYQMPLRFLYIVKALPVFNREIQDQLGLRMPMVAFDHFEEDGFVLYVSDFGEPIDPDRLNQLQLMIEVSEYAFGDQ